MDPQQLNKDSNKAIMKSCTELHTPSGLAMHSSIFMAALVGQRYKPAQVQATQGEAANREVGVQQILGTFRAAQCKNR